MTSRQTPEPRSCRLAQALAVCGLLAIGAADTMVVEAQATGTAQTPMAPQAPPPAPAPRRNIAGPGDYALREKLVRLISTDDALKEEQFRIILVNGGVVFSGPISNCAKRRRALTTAATIRGVVNVTDEMTVPRGDLPDAELAKAAVGLLGEASNELGLKDLDARVADGVLTLEGTVKDLASRTRAEEIAGGVLGINRISNRLRPANAPSGSDDASLQIAVTNYLGDFHNYGYASDLKVKVQQGVAVLTGRVALYLARQQAALAAAQVKGVVRVDNLIKIDPALTGRRTVVQAGT
ncbi:MAG TPA: BON domain-containing protein [Candidatus Polarisedimenticolia bacterium]|nr:BON domain-containing protein [Candidatus Polarisedimenticolia bacterium]